MELQRVGIKLFLEDAAAVRIRDFVPIFHGWIQKQVVKDHQLIDVHDYSHIHNGPGILLVAHEGNFSMDMGDGRLGLLYYRKAPLADGLTGVLKVALSACRLLVDESGMKGLRFRTDESLFIANDRLLAPNTDATMKQIEPVLLAAFGSAHLKLTRVNANPKERFAVRVQKGK
jgi:hypothetical protein